MNFGLFFAIFAFLCLTCANVSHQIDNLEEETLEKLVKISVANSPSDAEKSKLSFLLAREISQMKEFMKAKFGSLHDASATSLFERTINEKIDKLESAVVKLSEEVKKLSNEKNSLKKIFEEFLQKNAIEQQAEE